MLLPKRRRTIAALISQRGANSTDPSPGGGGGERAPGRRARGRPVRAAGDRRRQGATGAGAGRGRQRGVGEPRAPRRSPPPRRPGRRRSARAGQTLASGESGPHGGQDSPLDRQGGRGRPMSAARGGGGGGSSSPGSSLERATSDRPPPTAAPPPGQIALHAPGSAQLPCVIGRVREEAGAEDGSARSADPTPSWRARRPPPPPRERDGGRRCGRSTPSACRPRSRPATKSTSTTVSTPRTTIAIREPTAKLADRALHRPGEDRVADPEPGRRDQGRQRRDVAERLGRADGEDVAAGDRG